jgi:hypothetical protein
VNKKELVDFLLSQPDDTIFKFSTEGCTFTIGHALAVPEWKVVYLGLDANDLQQSLQTEMENDREPNENSIPSESDLQDRDAFLEALEQAENATDWKGDPTCETDEPCGPVCALTSVKPVHDNPALGVM